MYGRTQRQEFVTDVSGVSGSENSCQRWGGDSTLTCWERRSGLNFLSHYCEKNDLTRGIGKYGPTCTVVGGVVDKR
jgi:hypothetical protein